MKAFGDPRDRIVEHRSVGDDLRLWACPSADLRLAGARCEIRVALRIGHTLYHSPYAYLTMQVEPGKYRRNGRVLF